MPNYTQSRTGRAMERPGDGALWSLADRAWKLEGLVGLLEHYGGAEAAE